MTFDEVTSVLAPYSLRWRVGSHLHGTAGPGSDEDFLTVYHDPIDDVKVFRRFPEVRHDADDSHKLYSFREFCRLIVKGNPNAVEVVETDPDVTGENAVWMLGVLRDLRPHVRTLRLVGACLGHATGVNHAAGEKAEPTAADRKRLAHALRVALFGQRILTPADVFRVRQVKFGDVPWQRGVDWLGQELVNLEIHKQFVPHNDTLLQELLNHAFVDIYGDKRVY